MSAIKIQCMLPAIRCGAFCTTDVKAVLYTQSKGMFRLGVGVKANMSHVACKWAPKAINKKVT
jgi:hypothetical protein